MIRGCNNHHARPIKTRSTVDFHTPGLDLFCDLLQPYTEDHERVEFPHSFIVFSNDRKWIDYILIRQAHRLRVYDAKVHPQPPSPAKTDSDNNIVYAMVRLSGRISPNRRIPTKKQIQPFDLQKLRSDGDCGRRVVARIISKLPDLPLQPNRISEMAESFTKLLLML